MAAHDRTQIYLAHRETYARFLTATDAEARCDWHRWRGDYAEKREAVAAIDAAYTTTQSAFNLIDLEGIGPSKEAEQLVACIRFMHEQDEEPEGIWETFKGYRAQFVEAAREHLGGH
ncbi:hypothetical protein SAZ_26160 [Streptomyces noursei ZPM]|uniref:Uncharacterized protein n=1 Tax=Streptomyces noursei TaxID=1971 RepID=A0A059W6E9_STRNR|nr:hypothetical protein [Streptomyces noursei]AKA08839.1 hypothetical protein SAZ_26145 [Streptomyces noursei ZPM]AIA05365.1 hypothetical protein DC74_4893 [Streptomyces noursei]AKA08842.1 hypothetical protein SAZ_26160 [Streptomyces noursei ZPM]EOT05155.1 hypothetical protein K530_05143 [Streptomyces noursei CCRC 11814]EXU90288.1 hypothetical protein P354_17735 [Streptomyces noursei PD-1]